MNVSLTVQHLMDVLRTVTLSCLFFLLHPLKTSWQSVGEPDFCLLLLMQQTVGKKKKRHKNDTACKYVLPMETQNKLKQTQLADCLFILHHSRARGFSNHYLGCSWNTKHFLQKYCVEISLKRITILYQTITETLQSALFGFDFSVKIQ